MPLPHTLLEPGSLPANALVCGDPARATEISRHLENARLLADFREYRTLQGTYRGLPLVVTSHGIGAPGAAIAFEELIAAGVRRILRIGTCGGLRPEVDRGDLVLATAAVQGTGFGREFAPPGYPAVADGALTRAMALAAGKEGRQVHAGIVATKDSFYGGVGGHGLNYGELADARVLAVEMECAALFLVGSLRGMATGAILAVDGNVRAGGESMDSFCPHHAEVSEAKEVAIRIALEALVQPAD